LDFYTAYNQFYICDKESLRETGSESFWTTDAYEDRLAEGDGILGIGTQSYGHIRSGLIIEERAANIPANNPYDHIVEGGLNITSGFLEILDCPNSHVEFEVKLKPGKYRVRVYSSNLKNANIDENEGGDYYKIEIWPDTDMKRKVLKRYAPK